MYKTILVPIDIAHFEEGKGILNMAREHADEDLRTHHVTRPFTAWFAP